MKKQFICASKERATLENRIPAPYLRKKFSLDAIPNAAELSICGLGFYKLYLNGVDITKGALAPYISNPNHCCYYDTYQITKYLKQGENVIGILLGNGFYNPFGGAVWEFDKADWCNAPCVAVELTLDGKTVLEADESFKTHPSPIMFDELRMGEHYDAKQEIADWNLNGFDDSSWKNAIVAPTPKGELIPCIAEPIRVTKELKAIRILKEADGYVYDFGENNAGVCTMKIKAENAQRIELSHGEVLTDGIFDNYSTIFDRPDALFYPEYSQKDVYIAKGEGVEEYTPSFTYHGFRYVLVKGICEEQATKELLTYRVMSSDVKEIGGFSCSDETINTLFEMVKRSDRSNFYYFPTDCPHREKNGWTGDISLSADHFTLLYDVEKSFSQWLQTVRAAQLASGQIPCVVPTDSFGYGWGSGPAWDSVLFTLPYELYTKRGNLDVIKENADAMVRYFEYILEKRNEDGTVSIGLGDWCPVGKAEHQYNTPVEVSNTIMLMDMAKKTAKMLQAVCDTRWEAIFKISEEFRTTVREVLLDKNTMSLKGNTQTGQAMGLYYGVFTENEEQKAFQKLLEYIENNDNNFDCGCLGMHVLFHVLSKFGHAELAYQMITKKEYPSYRYLIDIGETTLPEWFRNDTPRRGSHNHHFFGDIARWFMTSIAGLNVINSTTVRIQPNFIEQLEYAEAYYELPAGKVSVNWKKTSAGIKIKVDFAEGIQYNIELPDNYREENGYIVKIVS